MKSPFPEFETYQSFCVDRMYYGPRFMGTAALVCVTKIEIVCTKRPCINYCCPQGKIHCFVCSCVAISKGDPD